ncbi:F0F1 ATP synthase subunit A [Actinopolymorpha alba]|uniref:F0F1 ATP synthase subunit A n=1 Tax=Actinopolymorpha alba TaxID=533267 RepID=UPI00035C4611|nr:F0F1 ATP synthase subunit A [Actinopolymorpha alba]
MSTVVVSASGGGSFVPPGPASFDLPPVIAGVTKPMMLVLLSAIIIVGFLMLTSRRAAVVPGRWQYAGEMAYGFVRNGIARDVIGGTEYLKFVPFFVAMFFFVLVNNLFATIPVVQFPTFSHAGYAYALAIISWIVYNTVGIRKHGFLGYLKHSTIPSGVPVAIYPLIIPMEFASNIIFRPITLALRLFANMFAGHLLIMLFALGAEFLLIEASGLIAKPAGVLTFAFGIAIAFLEILVQVLQAYVFTFLTAMYIAGALAEEH